MGEAIPFQETVAQTMCADCPIARIPDSYWQHNVHEGIVYSSQNLSEILGIFKDEAENMRPQGLAEKLNSVHDHLLALFPKTDEDPKETPGFELSVDTGLVRLKLAHQNYIEEPDVSLPARMFVSCMRRLMTSACATSVVGAIDRQMQEALVFGLGRDIELGADILEIIGKYGNDEEVHQMVQKIMNVLDATGSSSLREYIDYHARSHQGVVDRAVVLAAALFLRDRHD